MKLEAGMYVRHKTLLSSKYVKINKIKEIEEKENCLHIWLEDKDLITEKYLIKASHNIIDLIEVGDYVNGSKVIDISIIGKDKEKWVWVEQMEDTDNKYGDDYVGYNNEQIKSIVTKEQFEQMAYKVVE